MEKDDKLKYCPKCGTEYVPEIFRCTECNVELVFGSELDSLPDPSSDRRPKGSEASVSDEDDFVVAAQDVNEIQKDLIVGALEQEGIPCLLTGDQFATVPMYWSLEAKIWVPEKLLERALAIIEPLLEEVPLDESEAENGEEPE